MTLCFYYCVTISHLQSWSVFSWGGWDSGCLRCGWGLKPAEMVWTVSTFPSANDANRRNNPPPQPCSSKGSMHSIDRIMSLGINLGSAYMTVFMRPRLCISFSRGRETSECEEARKGALSTKWTPPLQVDPVVHPWPISFIFTTLTLTARAAVIASDQCW